MKLNLSPSCINLYYESPLQFYYTYISGEKPDTIVCDVYSLAGNIVHDCLENYSQNKSTLDILKFFEHEWVSKGLNTKLDIRYQLLNKESYRQAVLNGIIIINSIPAILNAEEKISISMYNEYVVKGFIDLSYQTSEGYYIIDWKTSNKVDSGESFKRQGLHYAYLIYKWKGFVPKRITFHYVKINEMVNYEFTEKDIQEYELFLVEFADMLDKKGNNKSEYELGNYDNIFNMHLEKCKKEAALRKNNIKLVIKGANIFLENPQIHLIQQLVKEFSYEMKDAYFIKKAMLKKGVKNYQPVVRLYNVKHNSLPIGFLNRLKKWFTNNNYTINIVDERQKLKDYDMPDKLANKELRQYQINAVDSIMNNRITFLQLATSGGKTLIAGEVIRRNKGLTIFITDRNILLTQTVKEFEKLFNIKIGTITEGKIEMGVITIATIQTLNARLKSKDKTIIKILSNIKTLIIDESHTAATKSYMTLSKYVTNATIRLGLSASYKREDGNEMCIEACVGSPEFKIEASELIEQGYIMKPNICFFKYNNLQNNDTNRDYHKAYDDKIVFNVNRNAVIIKLVNKFKNKNILIIISKIEHGKLLESQIQNSVFIHGSVEQNIRENWLNEMKNGEGKIIIGTASIISKGLDVPALDVMINATGNLSCITTIQSLGRVLRKHDGKNNAFYFDLFDTGIHFREHCEKRIEALKQEGHEVKIQ